MHPIHFMDEKKPLVERLLLMHEPGNW